MLACLFGALLMTLPYMWLTGVYALDIMVNSFYHICIKYNSFFLCKISSTCTLLIYENYQ